MSSSSTCLRGVQQFITYCIICMWCYYYFFLSFVSSFGSSCKVRSEARSQTNLSMKSTLKADMKSPGCLFMGVRDSNVFLFSLRVYPPTPPMCHVVMPTSLLNQETGNDRTPTALSHTYTNTRLHTCTCLL